MLAAHQALAEDELIVTEIDVVPPEAVGEPEEHPELPVEIELHADFADALPTLEPGDGEPSVEQEPTGELSPLMPAEPAREPSVLAALATAAVAGIAAVALPAAAATEPVAAVAAAESAMTSEPAEAVLEPLREAAQPSRVEAEPAAPQEPRAEAAAERETPIPAEPVAVALAETTTAPPTDLLAGIRDDVDEQLLPVFPEEAHELFPQAGEQLRFWRRYPDDAEAPMAL